MHKIIVILGSTASGKSDVAIKLASTIGGPAFGWKYKGAEIISADSRQVYRGMNIGSGKVTGSLESVILSDPASAGESKDLVFISEDVPHYLIDVADPNEDFNISHFKKLAEKKIEEILQRKKVPIICGGTGFWIKSIVDDVKLPEVKPDQVLRSMLRNKTSEELFSILKKLDPERAKNIDPKNKVRLIRAIEICKTLGKVPTPPSASSPFKGEGRGGVEFLQIGIDVPREILNEKIKKRLDQRFEQGMIEEVEGLHKNGVSWERLESFGLEYRWIARYLQNKITLDDAKEKLYFDIIHYAKRQMTWFKKDKRIQWLKDYKDIKSAVEKFLK